jgi:hypothetical protein
MGRATLALLACHFRNGDIMSPYSTSRQSSRNKPQPPTHFSIMALIYWFLSSNQFPQWLSKESHSRSASRLLQIPKRSIRRWPICVVIPHSPTCCCWIKVGLNWQKAKQTQPQSESSGMKTKEEKIFSISNLIFEQGTPAKVSLDCQHSWRETSFSKSWSFPSALK